MMSELVSSAQLAEMALPILPKSKQGIEHVAKRDSWPFEYIKGRCRGGRLKKFVLSGLPEEIQTAIREQQAAQLLAQVGHDSKEAAIVAIRKTRAENQKNGTVRAVALKAYLCHCGKPSTSTAREKHGRPHLRRTTAAAMMHKVEALLADGGYHWNYAHAMARRMLAMVRPPFVFFSSTRSELPTYLDLVAELRLPGWERFAGSQTLTVISNINCNSSYDDHLIY